MNLEEYRAVDACLNRCVEGLRVCEDILRFSTGAVEYSGRFKELRHRVFGASKIFPVELLLDARDVEGDGQKFFDLESEKSRPDVSGIFSANLRRAVEAARTLEEFFKLHDAEGRENPFQAVRFELYALEKEIVPLFFKRKKIEHFKNSLYAIIDSEFVDDYAGTAEKLIDGGASVVQLRMKHASRREVLEKAKIVSGICRERGAVFIVNDYPDIAMLSGADGIHLGQDDIPVSEARRILPRHMIIGVSTHSSIEAIEALKEKPDYIAVGPINDTVSKSGEKLAGIGTGIVDEIRSEVSVPIVAIGGITPSDINGLCLSGVDSFAIISYLYKNGEIVSNCKKLVDAVLKGQP